MVLRTAFHNHQKQSVCHSSQPLAHHVQNRAHVRRNAGVHFVALTAILFLACNREPKQSASAGNVDRGKEAIERYGCNACHNIPGIPGPKGMVGPPLDHMASRSLIAGKLPNKPDTMISWLQDPPKYDPQAAMPNLGVTPADSRDISAYLYTLK
jgi:cytochrome c